MFRGLAILNTAELVLLLLYQMEKSDRMTDDPALC
jgi:hypothetical protein